MLQELYTKSFESVDKFAIYINIAYFAQFYTLSDYSCIYHHLFL